MARQQISAEKESLNASPGLRIAPVALAFGLALLQGSYLRVALKTHHSVISRNNKALPASTVDWNEESAYGVCSAEFMAEKSMARNKHHSI